MSNDTRRANWSQAPQNAEDRREAKRDAERGEALVALPGLKEIGEVSPLSVEQGDKDILVDNKDWELISLMHAISKVKMQSKLKGALQIATMLFQAEVLKGSGVGEIVFFLPAVNYEIPQELYVPKSPCHDVQMENEVENWLPLLASMGIADTNDASDYGPSTEDTFLKEETVAQKNLQLNHSCKAATWSKAAADKQAKLDCDRLEQAIGHIFKELGVFGEGNATECSNWFFDSVLECHFYYSWLLNIVFVGDEAL